MVCPRCIMIVKQILDKLHIQFREIKLGEVILLERIGEEKTALLEEELKKVGFELINDKKSMLINQIKTEIINYVHYNQENFKHVNFSDFLSEKLAHDYSYMSKLFSSVEGITIEKYIILQKIEKVKELLIYDNFNLSEIAIETDYSSVQHLSKQFKEVTGLTPTQFKKQIDHERKSIDKI